MNAGQDLPTYVRQISPTRGVWRRRWLDLLLRLTVKRQMHAEQGLDRMRASQALSDARFAFYDPEIRRTPVDAAGVAAEWIEAPEHPFPAGADDCHATYRWLLAQGYHPRNIVIAGDSAGGNLSLVTLQRIKAAGEPQPACAVLLSPVVDFTLSSKSLVTNDRPDPMFKSAALVGLRALYAQPQQFLDPSVSPLFGDFAGLPPLLFQAGSTERLRDESLRAAARALQAFRSRSRSGTRCRMCSRPSTCCRRRWRRPTMSRASWQRMPAGRPEQSA